MDLQAVEQLRRERKRPPLERWHPPLSGQMEMRIDRDGRWWHEGRLIERSELRALFASILRREVDEQYYLVSPVEKWQIQVEDAPFLLVDMRVTGSDAQQQIEVCDNFGDWVTISAEHPLEVDVFNLAQGVPYVLMRDQLWAKFNRATFFELAQYAHEQDTQIGVYSGGRFWSLLLEEGAGLGDHVDSE